MIIKVTQNDQQMSCKLHTRTTSQCNSCLSMIMSVAWSPVDRADTYSTQSRLVPQHTGIGAVDKHMKTCNQYNKVQQCLLCRGCKLVCCWHASYKSQRSKDPHNAAVLCSRQLLTYCCLRTACLRINQPILSCCDNLLQQ